MRKMYTTLPCTPGLASPVHTSVHNTCAAHIMRKKRYLLKIGLGGGYNWIDAHLSDKHHQLYCCSLLLCFASSHLTLLFLGHCHCVATQPTLYSQIYTAGLDWMSERNPLQTCTWKWSRFLGIREYYPLVPDTSLIIMCDQRWNEGDTQRAHHPPKPLRPCHP